MFKSALGKVYAGLAKACGSGDRKKSFRQHRLMLGVAGAVAGAFGVQAAADAPRSSNVLPTDKLACHQDVSAPRTPTVLLSCGSFNPPTVMHLRMFDLASAALAQKGYDVWGCYMSPVADAYGKKGLAPVHHRLQMCQLAAADTSNVMVSAWEAAQPGYTRTLQVLKHVSDSLTLYMQQANGSSNIGSGTQQQQDTVHAAGLKAAAAAAAVTNRHNSKIAECGIPGAPDDSSRGASSSSRTRTPPSSGTPTAAANPQQQAPRVMLLCGADLLATIAQPGVWKDPDVILRDYGIVCICREGTDMQQLLGQPGSLLHQYRNNIIVVEEPVPNFVSSTRVRQLLADDQPVRYLVPDAVIAYVKQHGLYR